MRSYKAARAYFSFAEFIGSAAIVIGGLVAFFGAVAGAQTGFRGAGILPAVMAAAPGILMVMVGIFTLIYVQTARATVDSAEYAQQSLKLSRDQFEVSKQLLRLAGGGDQPITYTTDDKAGPTLETISFDTDAAEYPPTNGSDAGAEIPALSDPIHQSNVLEVIRYRRVQIERLENHFRIGNDLFPSLEIAQRAVNEPHMLPVLRIETP